MNRLAGRSPLLRQPREQVTAGLLDVQFEVESYLRYRGTQFVDRFEAFIAGREVWRRLGFTAYQPTDDAFFALFDAIRTTSSSVR